MKAILNLINEATKNDCLDNLSRAELRGLIEKIKAQAYSKIEQDEDNDKHTYTDLEVEAIQQLTLNCYKDLYSLEMEDYASTLSELRNWGVEFEEWWQSLNDDEKYDYLGAVDNFGAKKLKEFRYPDIIERLEQLVNDIKEWEWMDDDDRNIITKLNCIIDQLKKEEA